MPTGRILVSGASGDARLEWLSKLLRQHGYEMTLRGAALAPGSAPPISLTPILAGIELSRASSDERIETIAGLDEQVPPARPLLVLSNASSVDEAASYTVHAERVVGIGLFAPLREGMLVELLPGLGTDSGAVRRAAELLATLGLATETLPAGAWAVLPRIIAMIVNEATVAIAEGVATASDIDQAMLLGASYAQGPLALADEIGLAEILAVLDALYAEYGDDRYRAAPLLRRMVLAGYTGKAAGRGFHLYP